MTKTLTEQWKDGELSEGYYYIRSANGKECIDINDNWKFKSSLDCGTRLFHKEVKEVLAPVPSYERIKNLDRLEQFCELIISGEKQEWESIVKRGNRKEMAKWINERKNKTVDRLEKRLEIATKALKKIIRDYEINGIGYLCVTRAREALKEMEGVK